MILSAIGSLLTGPVPGADATPGRQRYSSTPQHCGSATGAPTVGRKGGRAAPPGPPAATGPPGTTEGRGRMPEPTTAPPPSTSVPPAELPTSLREAGLANWIREPLDDAVDRRRRIIVPPAAATMGTPLQGCQGALMAEARGPDALVMMGDNPALPPMPERPTLADFYRLRLSKTGTNHMLQSAKVARENGLDEKVI